MSRKRLGEILIDRHIISEEQLQAAIRMQRESNDSLGNVLIKQGLAREVDVVEALSEQQGIPFLDLDAYEIDAQLVRSLGSELSRSCCAVPLYRMGDAVTVAMAEPLNLEQVDAIAKGMRAQVNPVFGAPSSIQQVLDGVFGASDEISAAIESIDPKELEQYAPVEDEDEAEQVVSIQEDRNPVVRIVRAILNEAIERNATDIHIEPSEKHLDIRMRIDGMLVKQASPPESLHAGIVSRIKVLANMDIAERRVPQSGRIRYEAKDKAYDLRISCFPTLYGENIVIRLLHRESSLLALDGLRFTREELQIIKRALDCANGIILVTGPTGSGKTTTLYAALSALNDPSRKIHTLEDPVEYRVPGIRQTQVNPKIDLTFAKSLRELLRQDPDVIMVGEIRDVETAEIAIHASLTGHLVLSTLHTNTAAGSLVRLQNMGIEPYLVASSLRLVIAQRLIRLLCPACKEKDGDSDAVKVRFNLDRNTPPLAKSVGCRECNHVGYKGRRAIYELLTPTHELQALLIKNAPAADIEREARREGLVPLRDRGMEVALAGETTVAEVLRVT
jgi:type IV pilus assembly protein PilB